ncbi:MAG TPA: glutamate 5-kinase, partial [Dermatophilaceae bacterium]|nr:glutamate 5-kinase [Dermatophilaceae bacterium]
RPGATRLDVVHSADDLAGVDVGGIGSSVGTGGMATKVEAAAIATAAGIPTLLTSAALADVALSDDPAVGTIFVATGRRKPSRLLWLAHASKTHGRLLLDDGAVRAVVERSKSLLPAGITSVEGDFGAGEPVDLCRLDGGVVARGLVNYSSDELPALLGRSTRELARELGPEYEREVVHRDDLVVLV